MLEQQNSPLEPFLAGHDFMFHFDLRSLRT
jgi:hypothetical protein